MTMQSKITEHMPIKCADGKDHGQVDRIEGDYIKVTKDEQGHHHWFPMTMVDRVDTQVHLNVGHDQVHQQWLTEDPHSQNRS